MTSTEKVARQLGGNVASKSAKLTTDKSSSLCRSLKMAELSKSKRMLQQKTDFDSAEDR